MESFDTSDADLARTWRKNWLSSIYEFSDYSLQRYSWRGGLEPNNPHWSYIEFMCSYFDNCNLSDGYDSFVHWGFITAAEAAVVSAFHAAADKYIAPNQDDYDHDAILADPRWQEVVALAAAARDELLVMLNDPDEIDVLRGLRPNNSFKPNPHRGGA